jgi:hypothetical protein
LRVRMRSPNSRRERKNVSSASIGQVALVDDEIRFGQRK